MLLAEMGADLPCPVCIQAPCPCHGQDPGIPPAPIPVVVGSKEYMNVGLPIAPGTEPYWIAAGAVALAALIVILRR